MERIQAIECWLKTFRPDSLFTLAPASADASFRRYFRVTFENGATHIVMDAPPDRENLHPWLQVQALFQAAGVHVPDVLARNVEQGFLLIEDMGATTYLMEPSDENYRAAIDALIHLQLASRSGELPDYDRSLLHRELVLFPDWYVSRHLNIALSNPQREQLATTFEKILAVNLAEPQVFVHRDYHSRNLMVTAPNPGIIDFQDAVFGPLTYDLASLFKDAYIEWPEEHTLDWLARYWEKAKKVGLPVRADFGEFHRDYEWMGVQRHIKVLGIFARLSHRDGKDGYLKDMPLVAKYLRTACGRYRDLTPLLRLMDEMENRPQQTGYSF
ncbi:MAG: phosphotransferase [Rhodocyclaceae bacterium]|nr:phosphotransferase [Rhodocyclaceae bacterium]